MSWESEVRRMAGKRYSGGPSPKYESKEQIEGLIDQYFEDCEGELLTDADGNPVLDKFSQPIFINRRPPTTSGLARALGFRSRTSLWNYRGKKEFKDTIDAAMLRIEEYTEQRLFDRDGSNGAQFSLQFNFRGWKEEKNEEVKSPAINIICDIPKTAAESVEETATPEAGDVKADDGKD